MVAWRFCYLVALGGEERRLPALGHSITQLAVADDAVVVQPTMRTLHAQRQFLNMTCAVAIDLNAAQ